GISGFHFPPGLSSGSATGIVTLGLGFTFFTTLGVTTVIPLGAGFLVSVSAAAGLLGVAALAAVGALGFFAGADFDVGFVTSFFGPPATFLGGDFFAAPLAGLAGDFATFLALLAALAMSTVLM
ncbi:MAG: hypothetical protein CFK52_14905, partial [Chloracidobacterium sp. CP2_5A]